MALPNPSDLPESPEDTLYRQRRIASEVAQRTKEKRDADLATFNRSTYPASPIPAEVKATIAGTVIAPKPTATPSPSATPTAAVARARVQATPTPTPQKSTPKTGGDDFYSRVNSVASNRGTSAVDDPNKLTQHFLDLAGTTTNNTRAPVTESDIMSAANSAGHDPAAQERLFNLRQEFNSPENQRALAAQDAFIFRQKVEDAKAGRPYSGNSAGENVAIAKAAGTPYVEGGVVNNPPAGTAGKDFNTNTGEWVPSNAPSYINGQSVRPTGPQPTNGLASQSDINAANAKGWQATPSGGYVRSTPTVGELRQTLDQATAARDEVAKREQQRQAYGGGE